LQPNSFSIQFTKLYDKKKYRAQVRVVTRTDKIIKVTVSAGTKELYLKKFLFRKKHKWVKVGSNFDMFDTRKPNLQMLDDIIKAVDEKI
jgi:hypothetical protein